MEKVVSAFIITTVTAVIAQYIVLLFKCTDTYIVFQFDLFYIIILYFQQYDELSIIYSTLIIIFTSAIIVYMCIYVSSDEIFYVSSPMAGYQFHPAVLKRDRY